MLQRAFAPPGLAGGTARGSARRRAAGRGAAAANGFGGAEEGEAEEAHGGAEELRELLGWLRFGDFVIFGGKKGWGLLSWEVL